jgi:V/A-type H+-transporting ATPase subunit C
VARLDFANTRLGARRARLAGPADLRALLSRPSLDARIALLRTLPVGTSVPEEIGADPIATVERALRTALRAETLAVLEDAEGSRARDLLGAFVSLDEAEVVKAVLRGVAQGAAPTDRTAAAVPELPGLPAGALRRAAGASSLAAALDALSAGGSGLAATVREALGAGAHPLLRLEIAADHAAIRRALAACRRRGEDGAVLAGHLADRADARNAATLLLLAGAAPAPSPWIPGGRRWDDDALAALARAGLAPARAAVSRAFPGVEESALAQPWQADRALERALVAALHREARRRPLSIAVPLAYLVARREEVRRVTLLLRGADLELPGDELLDLVEA